MAPSIWWVICQGHLAWKPLFRLTPVGRPKVVTIASWRVPTMVKQPNTNDSNATASATIVTRLPRLRPLSLPANLHITPATPAAINPKTNSTICNVIPGLLLLVAWRRRHPHSEPPHDRCDCRHQIGAGSEGADTRGAQSHDRRVSWWCGIRRRPVDDQRDGRSPSSTAWSPGPVDGAGTIAASRPGCLVSGI